MKALSKIAVIAAAAALLTAMLTVFPAAAKTPVISLNPQSVRWPATAKAAVYSCRCSNENTEYGPEFEREWYFFYNGMDFAAKDVFAKPIDYPFGDFDKDGSGFVGTTIMIANPGKGLEGTEIYCVVKSDDSHFAESTHATILFDSAAISSEAPEFTSVPAEITATAGKSFTITCDYTYQGQCSTTPMWYETPNGKLENIQLIMDAGEKKSFTDKRNSPGDYYYVFAVELESLNGKDTSISYSSPIHVRVKAGGGEQSEQSVGLEITSLPKKTSYFLGDTLSLKGLVVRYYTDLGFQDIKDGKGMGVSPTTLTKFGTNRITLIYEGLTTYFDVEVEGAPAIPLIDSLSPGVTEKLGTPVTLSVGAHSTDGGTLTYQWYSTNVNDISTIKAIFDDEKNTSESNYFITVPQEEGTVYYAVAVWNNRAGGLSQPVYSDLIPVTYEKAAQSSENQGGTQEQTQGGQQGGAQTTSPGAGNGGSKAEEPTVPLRTVVIIGLGVLASVLVVVVAAILISRVNAKERNGGR